MIGAPKALPVNHLTLVRGRETCRLSMVATMSAAVNESSLTADGG